MEWDVPEHLYYEKSNDWIAAVLVIAFVLVAAEVFYHSYLLVVLTLIATFTFLLLSVRKPKILRVAITRSGIRAGNTFYPFSSLDAFAVIDHPKEHKILLESAKPYLPLIVIPIADTVDREEIWEALSRNLPSKELREPFSHILFDYLGF